MIPRLLTAVDAWAIARNLRASDQEEIFATHWPGEELPRLIAGAMACAPFAYCFEHAGRPAVAVGALALHPGVWRVWAFCTDDFRLVGFSVTKWIRRSMIPALLVAGAHRAEALSIDGHAEAHRWLEALGARREATLKGFGREGQDFHVYAWRRDVLGSPAGAEHAANT